MKLCLHCSQPFNGVSWKCPGCGFLPDKKNGYLSFAPELSSDSGFKDAHFSQLVDLEENNFWFRARNQLILWALGKYFPNAQNLMEIGCGTGFVLSAIRSEYREMKLFGSEISSEGLAFAGDRVPEAQLFQMDARAIPFIGELDVIGAFDVLEHIEEDDQVLNQFHRALKSDGGVLITVPQHDFLWSEADEHACHVRRYSKKDLHRKLLEAGFTIERITSFVSFLLPFMMLSRSFGGAKHGVYDPLRELKISGVVNFAFEKIMMIERLALRSNINFLAGGSLLVIAKK